MCFYSPQRGQWIYFKPKTHKSFYIAEGGGGTLKIEGGKNALLYAAVGACLLGPAGLLAGALGIRVRHIKE